MLSAIFLAAALLDTSAAADTGESPAQRLYTGARVEVQATPFGPGWLPGRVAHAVVRGTMCLGVALERKDAGGQPMLVLLKGITAMKVDRRTNIDAVAVGLGEPEAGDWQTVSLRSIIAQDSTCAIRTVPPPRR